MYFHIPVCTGLILVIKLIHGVAEKVMIDMEIDEIVYSILFLIPLTKYL